jgi:WD40 repeat protein
MIAATRLAAVLAPCCAPVIIAFAATTSPAQPPPPSYQRDVVPILRTACVGCHGAQAPAGGLALGSYAELMRGGKNGAAIVPGKSGASRLVLMLTGAVKPQMPPGGGGLKAADIETIRRWVDAGAKNDAPPKTALSSGKPSKTAVAAATVVRAPRALGTLRANVAPPVHALAFSPDGKTLAVGTYQRVLLCDPATRAVKTVWNGHADAVRALAFSPDGKWLASGGGTSGALGQVRVWSVAGGREARVFGNQTDAVNTLAFSPDGKLLATGSADKTIQVWDTATARPLQTLRDHADAVLGLAFRSDGKFLASCSADKSVKIWDTATWRRLYTLGAHDEPVTSVAFAPNGSALLTTSADRTAKVWNFGPESSGLARALPGHGHGVLLVALTPDGQLAATASADKTIKLWNVGSGANTATLADPKDWVYAVAFSPDGKRLAGGTWDGAVTLWNIETQKVEGAFSTRLRSEPLRAMSEGLKSRAPNTTVLRTGDKRRADRSSVRQYGGFSEPGIEIPRTKARHDR